MLLIPDNVRVSGAGSAFLSKYAALLDIVLRVGDVAIVVLAAQLSYWACFGIVGMEVPYDSVVLLTVLLVLLVFPAFGLYRSWRGESVSIEIGRLAVAWLLVSALLVMAEWIVTLLKHYSREWFSIWFVVTILMLAGYRVVARRVLGSIRARGIDSRDVVIIGATDAGRKIVEAARKYRWMGLDVIGQVHTDFDQDSIKDVPVLHSSIEGFINSLQKHVPDQIWLALPLRAEALIQQILEATSDLPTTIRLVPDMFGYELIHNSAATLAGVPVITLRGSRIDGHSRIIKAVEDRLLASIILLMISPLLLLIAVGIKLTSRGPILFKQKRHGLGGIVVEVWKFRSMRVHAETQGKVTQATRGDPRITPFGRFLRSSSLDELPQFFNVLQGHMSIVGPRPHAVEHNDHYQKLVSRYMQRHSVKPGITGLAQINGCRGETDSLEKMERRVNFDLKYIRNWSIWLDLRIIAITAVRGFFDKNSY